jgi:hypothetical protein
MNITPEQLRDISEQVYRKRLDDDCPEIRDHKGVVTRKGNVQRMLEKDAEKDPNDNGRKLRNRAGSYDQIVRAVLEVIGYEPT